MSTSTQAAQTFTVIAPPDWYVNATNWVFGLVAAFAIFEIIIKITTGRFAKVH